MMVKLRRLLHIPLFGLWMIVKLSSADIPLFQLERSGVLRKIRIDKVTHQFETTKKGLHSVNSPLQVRRRRSVHSGNFDGSSPDSKTGSSSSGGSSKSSNKRRHDGSLGLDLLINFQDAPWILAATKYKDAAFVKRRRRPRSLDAYDVLSEFRHWVKKEGENLPEHDHAISVT
uniref:Uncharacterized protein n=1 Tax=Romanomermis culicivorax TaxID=13658 RepID=A0A915IIY2_ROMCU